MALREEIILEELRLVEYLTWRERERKRERERDRSNKKSHGRDEGLHEEGKSCG